MFEFRDKAKTSVEEELRLQIEALEKELHKSKSKEKYIKDINTILEGKSVSDDLYRTMYLYLIEVLELINQSQFINIHPIKEYLENLLDGVRIEVFVGEALYKELYSGERGIHTEEEISNMTLDLSSLYNLATSDLNIAPLLKEVSMKTSLVELSDIKLNPMGLGMYKGVVVWVMEPLLGIVPGFTVMFLENKKFLTPIEKEVITVFMKMVQPVLYGRILTGRLTAEVEQAMKSSHTDVLTGLNNRKKFHEDYMDNTSAGKEYVAFLDLCRLKQVNDTHGHDIADEVLKRLAIELEEYAGKLNGISYRIGGDEFVVTIPYHTNESLIKARTQEFQDYWAKVTFQGLDEKPFTSNVSIGVFQNEKLGLPRHEAVKEADQLMYKSKEDRVNYTIQYNF